MWSPRHWRCDAQPPHGSQGWLGKSPEAGTSVEMTSRGEFRRGALLLPGSPMSSPSWTGGECSWPDVWGPVFLPRRGLGVP